MEKRSHKPSAFSRGKNTVPVSSRDRARARQRASEAAAEKGKKRAKERAMHRAHPGEAALIVVVIIVVLWVIAQPLSNFYEQRSEIARLHESIAAKQAEKDDLQIEIDRYDDENYVREQARNRLGVIEPGESAFRILDPRLQRESAGQITEREEELAKGWYEVLWDSVVEPAQPEEETNPAPQQDPDTHMPIQPDPDAVPQ